MEILKVAVLSDLHPIDKSRDEVGSFMDIGGQMSPERSPVEGLKKLIETEKVVADIVLCAGDIGNKSNPASISYGWDQLQKIRGYLGAGRLIAVPGNHDHDSRQKYNKFDPKYFLQTLSPPFPFEDEDLNNQFWASHWAVTEYRDVRIVTLNSSAYHGINNEYDHGRLAPKTIEKIKSALDKGGERRLNILLCHHHPQKQEEIDLEDYEVMDGGQKLIEMLGSGGYGYWAVVHGHKHWPKIFYAQGTTSYPPIIFSSGSFSADLHPEFTSRGLKNQFYIFEFHIDKFPEFGCVGTFRSWDWSLGTGWLPAGDRSGLPATGGFGVRDDMQRLAATIDKGLGVRPFVRGNTPYEEFPMLRYLVPADIDVLKLNLSKKHGVEMDVRNGLVREIGRSQ